MGFDKSIIQAHTEDEVFALGVAYGLYQKGGAWGVCEAVSGGRIQHDGWRRCVPCESEYPYLGNTCLVCGDKR